MRYRRMSLVGIDGSGKSSCLEDITEKLTHTDMAAIGDTILIRKNGVLEKLEGFIFEIGAFLGKKAKGINNRSLYKLLKLFDLLIRAKAQSVIEDKYKVKLLVTDGAPLVNILGWGSLYYRKLLTQELLKECILYLTGNKIPWKSKFYFLRNLPEVFFINLFSIKLQKPDVIFFLKTDPQMAISRIKTRDQKRQIHETEEFLYNLQEAYCMVCKFLSSEVKIYNIDTDKKTKDMIVFDILKKIYENN